MSLNDTFDVDGAELFMNEIAEGRYDGKLEAVSAKLGSYALVR
ncbi:hypothetical protein ACFVKB_38105 [Rhodococcus sp. NPDC127530]